MAEVRSTGGGDQRAGTPVNMDRTARLYGAAIAIVSGLYAVASPAYAMMQAPMMGARAAAPGIGGWIMLVLGVVVLVHGVMLLTPAAARIGRASGPLMIVWAALMLANQALLAAVPGIGMRDMMGGRAMSGDMAWDAGMVAIAALMLISGLIMTGEHSSRSRI